jgi:hypothetical protein
MTDATHPFDALMEITARPPVVFVRGAGSYLWDDSRTRSAIRRRPLRKRLPHRPNCC